MCGACPGGGQVSNTTALLNARGLKRRLLANLQRCLFPGCTLSIAGDRWTLRRRTGRLETYSDIEALLDALEDSSSKDWASVKRPHFILQRTLEADQSSTE